MVVVTVAVAVVVAGVAEIEERTWRLQAPIWSATLGGSASTLVPVRDAGPKLGISGCLHKRLQHGHSGAGIYYRASDPCLQSESYLDLSQRRFDAGEPRPSQKAVPLDFFVVRFLGFRRLGSGIQLCSSRIQDGRLYRDSRAQRPFDPQVD